VVVAKKANSNGVGVFRGLKISSKKGREGKPTCSQLRTVQRGLARQPDAANKERH